MTAPDQYRNEHVLVVVLGDVGRSPRMQYHALSLANQLGLQVTLLGLGDTPAMPALATHPRIQIKTLRDFPWSRPSLTSHAWLDTVLLLLFAMCKVLYQTVQLLATMWSLSGRVRVSPGQSKAPTRWLVMQTPPALPLLPVAFVLSLLRPSLRLCVDWHNYAWSILRLRRGTPNWLVQLARRIEYTCGRWASAHLCVTHAMRADLLRQLGSDCDISVLHDRPADAFRELSPPEMHRFLQRLHGRDNGAGEVYNDVFPMGERPAVTVRTRATDGKVSTRSEGPFLVVTATSWTDDEDVALLLHVAQQLDQQMCDKSAEERRLVYILITGKGPNRQDFERQAASLSLRYVSIRTVWLAHADYPRLLASCHVGVSLHTSSSGLDLPMKVVDMQGAHLPVCAVEFPCISELVQHGSNGFIFAPGDAQQLTRQLVQLMDESLRHSFVQTLRRDDQEKGRWDANWNANAARVFHV
ncbi:MAG: hypothetical protein MHM6MM_004058 [Cercozoa sp. M6MM]